MPKDLVGTEDVSSTSSEEALDVENQDTAGETQEGSEDHQADPESSTGQDGKEAVSEKAWDPLAVVKKAVEDTKEDQGGSDGDPDKRSDGSSKSENGSQKSETEAEALGDVTEEELKSYKPKTRKRIEGLLDDRQRLTERVAQIEPAAEQMETLQTFMKERNLTSQNVSELLVVGGLAMSEDPKDLRAALTRAEAFVTQIKGQLGDVIPEDLQKKVSEGLLDAETAKEVAAARVEKARAEAKAGRAESASKTYQQDSQSEREKSAITAVHGAISEWEGQKKSSDPDYPRKAELVQKEIKLRVMAEGGRVLDKNKALKIAEEAYKEVNRLYKSLLPTTSPQPKKFLQSKTVRGSMASKPSSPLDAARAGLAKAHGG